MKYKTITIDLAKKEPIETPIATNHKKLIKSINC